MKVDNWDGLGFHYRYWKTLNPWGGGHMTPPQSFWPYLPNCFLYHNKNFRWLISGFYVYFMLIGARLHVKVCHSCLQETGASTQKFRGPRKSQILKFILEESLFNNLSLNTQNCQKRNFKGCFGSKPYFLIIFI